MRSGEETGERRRPYKRQMELDQEREREICRGGLESSLEAVSARPRIFFQPELAAFFWVCVRLQVDEGRKKIYVP